MQFTLHTHGNRAFTNKVLSVAVQALGIEYIPEYREDLYKDKPIGF